MSIEQPCALGATRITRVATYRPANGIKKNVTSSPLLPKLGVSTLKIELFFTGSLLVIIIYFMNVLQHCNALLV